MFALHEIDIQKIHEISAHGFPYVGKTNLLRISFIKNSHEAIRINIVVYVREYENVDHQKEVNWTACLIGGGANDN